MIYNFKTVMRDLEDKPITQPVFEDEPELIICSNCQHEISRPKVKEQEDLTLSLIARSALVNLDKSENELSGDKKNDRFILATRIKNAEKADGKMNLDLNEVSLIGKLIDKKFGTVVVGRCRHIFNNEGEKPGEEDGPTHVDLLD